MLKNKILVKILLLISIITINTQTMHHEISYSEDHNDLRLIKEIKNRYDDHLRGFNIQGSVFHTIALALMKDMLKHMSSPERKKLYNMFSLKLQNQINNLLSDNRNLRYLNQTPALEPNALKNMDNVSQFLDHQL